MKQSDKLKLLSRKVRESQSITLDDVILADFSSSLCAMNGGTEQMVSVYFDCGKSLCFSFPIQRKMNWQTHLTEIVCTVDALSVDDAEAGYLRVMHAEGWVFGQRTVKTPAWLYPHAELTYDAMEAHGFDWIKVPNR